MKHEPSSVRPIDRIDRRAAFVMLVATAGWPRLLVAVCGFFGYGVLATLDARAGTGIDMEIFYLLLFTWWAWAGYPKMALAVAVVTSPLQASIHASGDGVAVFVFHSALALAGPALAIGMTAWLRDAVIALDRQARLDPTTGVFNSRAFRERAEIERLRARRDHAPVSIVFIDLDEFKRLNDLDGHLAGDAALRRFAAGLAASVRATDIVGRAGGDEFVILLPNTDCRAAAEVVQRVQHLAARMPAPISFSAGIATFPIVPDSVDEMLNEADSLMYVAKHRGKGRQIGRVIEAETISPSIRVRDD